MKSKQVKHGGEKARRRESETERDIWGDGRATQWPEKIAWVDLTIGLNQQHLRISTTPQIFLKVSINYNNRSIRH